MIVFPVEAKNGDRYVSRGKVYEMVAITSPHPSYHMFLANPLSYILLGKGPGCFVTSPLLKGGTAEERLPS